jgi:hypothetical protein
VANTTTKSRFKSRTMEFHAADGGRPGRGRTPAARRPRARQTRADRPQLAPARKAVASCLHGPLSRRSDRRSGRAGPAAGGVTRIKGHARHVSTPDPGRRFPAAELTGSSPC